MSLRATRLSTFAALQLFVGSIAQMHGLITSIKLHSSGGAFCVAAMAFICANSAPFTATTLRDALNFNDFYLRCPEWLQMVPTDVSGDRDLMSDFGESE